MLIFFFLRYHFHETFGIDEELVPIRDRRLNGCIWHPGVVTGLGKPAKKNIVETFSTISIFEVTFDK